MKRAFFGAVVVSVLGLVGACVGDPPTGLLSGATGTGSTTTSKSASNASTGSSMSTTSSGMGGAGGMLPAADYTMSIDKPDATVTLASELTVTISIDPKGYVGDVLLGVSSLDAAGLTGTFGKTSLTLDGSTVAKTTFTLASSSSTPPATVGYTITAASEAGAATTTGAVSVLSDITIVIPTNVAGLPGSAGAPYKDAFGPYPTVIIAPTDISAANPVTVRFFNDDEVEHEIHAGQGGDGFPHDTGPIAPNSMDTMVRKVTAKGTYDYYLHDQGVAQTVGRIVIQ